MVALLFTTVFAIDGGQIICMLADLQSLAPAVQVNLP
jgi:hypothetical protein